VKLENKVEVTVGEYRYLLSGDVPARYVGEGTAMYIALNPSVAGALRDDPTWLHMGDFTQRLGYRRQVVGNVFGYRTTFPHEIPRNLARAVGPDNDHHLLGAMREAAIVIAAWGAGGNKSLRDMIAYRVPTIRALAELAGRELMALAVTSDGSPKHPHARGLHRIPDDARPAPWRPR